MYNQQPKYYFVIIISRQGDDFIYNNINYYAQLPTGVFIGGKYCTIYERWTMVDESIIPNIKPLYFVSTFGRVYSYNTNDFIKGSYRSGYLNISVKLKDCKSYTVQVHRLVMIAFHPIPHPENFVVNHIDGDKTNNHIWNLEWCTNKENTQHALMMGLMHYNDGEKNHNCSITEVQAEKICKMLISGKYNCVEIAEQIGCAPGVVYQISAGNAWKHLVSKYDVINKKKLRK